MTLKRHSHHIPKDIRTHFFLGLHFADHRPGDVRTSGGHLLVHEAVRNWWSGALNGGRPRPGLVNVCITMENHHFMGL